MAREQVPKRSDGETAQSSSSWRFAPVALVLAGLSLGYAMGWHRYLSLDYLADSREALKVFVAANPVLAPLCFMLIYTLAVAFSVPASAVLTIFGGFLFGFLPATVYALLSATVGATVIFLAARTAFGDFLRRKASGRTAALAAGFQKDAFTYILALRFAPFIPFAIVNIAAALFNVRLRSFVTATFLGIIPIVAGYAWLGQGLDSVLAAAKAAGRHARPSDLITPQITIAFVGLALLAILAAIVKKVRGSG